MSAWTPRDIGRDVTAGLVVYLVALPLCLGIALASQAPLASGLISGIIGGIVVGALSGSHTSVSGPAAGLTAVVAAQIAGLGSFQAFLLAVVVAGLMQVGLGLLRAGFIASFFPSSVIKGLLAAIGVILILKQLPHVVGHDKDIEGEMGFIQPDGENSFTELVAAFFDIQPGAAAIGLLSIVLLLLWQRVKVLKNSPIPGPLVAVLLGLGLNELLKAMGSQWVVDGEHLVQVPRLDTMEGLREVILLPDFTQLTNPAIYVGAFTIAVVASLETLLNLDAVDQIDPQQRRSPPNRELVAQGVGNMLAGLVGGLPMTSVIVRSSVNIGSGNKTKASAILHGFLLVASLLAIPGLLNAIPLSCLAAILFVTGLKLASPALFREMWKEGRPQFLPFIMTVGIIVFTDLLTGVVLGLVTSLVFILWSNYRRPVQMVRERHVSGDVLRIELPNQVSFLKRAALERALRSVSEGEHVLVDARASDYIDPDILDLIHEFEQHVAPAHGVEVSLVGFRDEYARFEDRIRFIDYSTRELQQSLTPAAVFKILEEGNQRFRSGEQISRDLRRQTDGTAAGQAPIAVVLSCIDSRTPAEHVFDLGIGDIFSVRVAGNVARAKVLGSIEYSTKVAGAKLIVVMGHTRCGAVKAAVDLSHAHASPAEATGCEHIGALIDEIQQAIPAGAAIPEDGEKRAAFEDDVALRNVRHTMEVLTRESGTLRTLLEEEQIGLVGAMYDVATGEVRFLDRLAGASEDAAERPRAAALLAPSAG